MCLLLFPRLISVCLSRETTRWTSQAPCHAGASGGFRRNGLPISEMAARPEPPARACLHRLGSAIPRLWNFGKPKLEWGPEFDPVECPLLALSFVPEDMAEKLHIAFITSEMVPFVKTGGLGDISAALPKALARLGHRVTVVLPRYAAIQFPPREFAGSVHVPRDSNSRSAGVYRASAAPGVDVVFVEHPPFYHPPAPYGYPDHN